MLGTGQGLRAWQAAGAVLPPAAARFAAILLDPPREALRAAIATRFTAMLAAGALAEVKALAAQGLDPALPAMRAHGVPELLAQLGGGLTPAAAAARAVLHTGHYTKRQATWFRHHALAPPGATHIIYTRIEGMTQFQESRIGEIFAFVQNWR